MAQNYVPCDYYLGRPIYGTHRVPHPPQPLLYNTGNPYQHPQQLPQQHPQQHPQLHPQLPPHSHPPGTIIYSSIPPPPPPPPPPHHHHKTPMSTSPMGPPTITSHHNISPSLQYPQHPVSPPKPLRTLYTAADHSILTHTGSPGDPKAERFLVIQQVLSSLPEYLVLEKGDVVLVTPPNRTGHWWRGCVEGTNRIGIFPSHLVIKLPQTPPASHASGDQCPASGQFTAANSPTKNTNKGGHSQDIDTQGVIGKFCKLLRTYGPLDVTDEPVLGLMIGFTSFERKLVMALGGIQGFCQEMADIIVDGTKLSLPEQNGGDNASAVKKDNSTEEAEEERLGCLSKGSSGDGNVSEPGRDNIPDNEKPLKSDSVDSESNSESTSPDSSGEADEYSESISNSQDDAESDQGVSVEKTDLTDSQDEFGSCADGDESFDLNKNMSRREDLELPCPTSAKTECGEVLVPTIQRGGHRICLLPSDSESCTEDISDLEECNDENLSVSSQLIHDIQQVENAVNPKLHCRRSSSLSVDVAEFIPRTDSPFSCGVREKSVSLSQNGDSPLSGYDYAGELSEAAPNILPCSAIGADYTPYSTDTEEPLPHVINDREQVPDYAQYSQTFMQSGVGRGYRGLSPSPVRGHFFGLNATSPAFRPRGMMNMNSGYFLKQVVELVNGGCQTDETEKKEATTNTRKKKTSEAGCLTVSLDRWDIATNTMESVFDPAGKDYCELTCTSDVGVDATVPQCNQSSDATVSMENRSCGTKISTRTVGTRTDGRRTGMDAMRDAVVTSSKMTEKCSHLQSLLDTVQVEMMKLKQEKLCSSLDHLLESLNMRFLYLLQNSPGVTTIHTDYAMTVAAVQSEKYRVMAVVDSNIAALKKGVDYAELPKIDLLTPELPKTYASVNALEISSIMGAVMKALAEEKAGTGGVEKCLHIERSQKEKEKEPDQFFAEKDTAEKIHREENSSSGTGKVHVDAEPLSCDDDSKSRPAAKDDEMDKKEDLEAKSSLCKDTVPVEKIPDEGHKNDADSYSSEEEDVEVNTCSSDSCHDEMDDATMNSNSVEEVVNPHETTELNLDSNGLIHLKTLSDSLTPNAEHVLPSISGLQQERETDFNNLSSDDSYCGDEDADDEEDDVAPDSVPRCPSADLASSTEHGDKDSSCKPSSVPDQLTIVSSAATNFDPVLSMSTPNSVCSTSIATSSASIPASSAPNVTSSASIPASSASIPASSGPNVTSSASIPTSSSLSATSSASILASSAPNVTSSASIPRSSSLSATSSASIPTSSALSATSSASIPTSSALSATSSASIPTSSALSATSSGSISTSSALSATSSASIPTSSALRATSSSFIPLSSALNATSSASIPKSSAPIATSTVCTTTSSETISGTTSSVPNSVKLSAENSQVAVVKRTNQDFVKEHGPLLNQMVKMLAETDPALLNDPQSLERMAMEHLQFFLSAKARPMGAMPGSMGAMPGSMGAMPGSMGAMPSSVGAMPSSMGAMPSTVGAMPGGMGAMLSTMGAMPHGMGAMPSGMGAMPSGMGAMPSGMGAMHSGMGAMPSTVGTMPSTVGTMPSTVGTMPNGMGAMPSGMYAMPRTVGAMPSTMGAMPGGIGAMPGSMGTMSGHLGPILGGPSNIPGGMGPSRFMSGALPAMPGSIPIPLPPSMCSMPPPPTTSRGLGVTAGAASGIPAPIPGAFGGTMSGAIPRGPPASTSSMPVPGGISTWTPDKATTPPAPYPNSASQSSFSDQRVVQGSSHATSTKPSFGSFHPNVPPPTIRAIPSLVTMPLVKPAVEVGVFALKNTTVPPGITTASTVDSTAAASGNPYGVKPPGIEIGLKSSSNIDSNIYSWPPKEAQKPQKSAVNSVTEMASLQKVRCPSSLSSSLSSSLPESTHTLSKTHMFNPTPNLEIDLTSGNTKSGPVASSVPSGTSLNFAENKRSSPDDGKLDVFIPDSDHEKFDFKSAKTYLKKDPFQFSPTQPKEGFGFHAKALPPKTSVSTFEISPEEVWEEREAEWETYNNYLRKGAKIPDGVPEAPLPVPSFPVGGAHLAPVTKPKSSTIVSTSTDAKKCSPSTFLPNFVSKKKGISGPEPEPLKLPPASAPAYSSSMNSLDEISWPNIKSSLAKPAPKAAGDGWLHIPKKKTSKAMISEDKPSVQSSATVEEDAWQQAGTRKNKRTKSVSESVTTGPTASKSAPKSEINPKMKSFEKLLGKLMESIPNLTRTDGINLIQEVRDKRQGLKGIPMSEILSDAAAIMAAKKVSSNKATPTPDAASILYKTSLCEFWKSGNCPHGTACLYAHGKEELRSAPKCILCAHVRTKKKCPFGSKCVFSHSEAEVFMALKAENEIMAHKPSQGAAKSATSSSGAGGGTVLNTGSLWSTQARGQANTLAPRSKFDCLQVEENDWPECPICCDGIPPHHIKKLSCKHAFHDECIKQWVLGQGERNCPVCRRHALLEDEFPQLG